MAQPEYESIVEALEVSATEHIDSFTLPGIKGESESATTFKVNPPVTVPPGTYTVMVSKSLMATRGTADAVSYRIEDDVIYVDPIYNASGQPGY
jgi:hypothetical protein